MKLSLNLHVITVWLHTEYKFQQTIWIDSYKSIKITRHFYSNTSCYVIGVDVSAFTHFLKREKSFESRKRYNSEATIRAAIHCVRLRNTRKRSVRAAKNVRHDVIRWRRLLVVDDFAHGHAPHGVNALSLDIRLSYLSSTREIGNVSRNDTAGVGNWVFEWNGGNCYEERERRRAGKQCLCCERIVEYIVRACDIDESMSSDMFCWIMVSIAAQLNKLASDLFFLSYRTCTIIMLVFYKNYTCQILIYYIPWCRWIVVENNLV